VFETDKGELHSTNSNSPTSVIKRFFMCIMRSDIAMVRSRFSPFVNGCLTSAVLAYFVSHIALAFLIKAPVMAVCGKKY